MEIWYNIISSTGNDGPCLTTISAPQSVTHSIISIGAIFTNDIIVSQYGIVDNINKKFNVYSCSLRGLTSDSAICVEICVPGGSITNVPTYTFTKKSIDECYISVITKLLWYNCSIIIVTIANYTIFTV